MAIRRWKEERGETVWDWTLVTEFSIQSIPIAHPVHLKSHDVFIRITALHIFQFKDYKGGYTAGAGINVKLHGTRKLCRHRDRVEKKKKKGKEKGRSFSHVRGTSCAPPPRGVYPLIYHDPWLQSETRGYGEEAKKRDKKKKGTNVTEKESRPSRGDRFPLLLFAPLSLLLRHLFFSSRAGKSISSPSLRRDRIRYALRIGNSEIWK